jgi:hypothetical protein
LICSQFQTFRQWNGKENKSNLKFLLILRGEQKHQYEIDLADLHPSRLDLPTVRWISIQRSINQVRRIQVKTQDVPVVNDSLIDIPFPLILKTD